MDLIKFSIKNPVTIIVSVLIVVLFGFISLGNLPYQLTPSVSTPEIKITTVWPGATPYEIEREIIEEQEDALKSLNNLTNFESTSKDNYSELTLTFKLGTNLRAALQDVSNKLSEVQSYPSGVKEPRIESASASPVIWMMLQTKNDNARHIDEYKTFYDDEIEPALKRVDGVAGIMGGGGRKQEMQIVFEPNKLASYGLSAQEVIRTLQDANVDVSAGVLNLDRHAYRIRTVNKFTSVKDIEDVILISNREQRIHVSDIAAVNFGYESAKTVAMFLDKDGIFIGIQPNSDVNIVKLTNDVEKVVNDLNTNILNDKDLKLQWIYDQRPYIVGAVDLVKENIGIGAFLAIFILVLFLRAISPTAVISAAIPISVIGTFIVLDMMGRSLNTISLAGISFAVGMLVDSAIVVLENIDRHRKNGESIADAAYKGASEVWGALIASALTTIAVFLPIVFLEDEAGQLFKDIAIAVTASVTFSLFVSISVIPMLWKSLASLSTKEPKDTGKLVDFGNKLVDIIMSIVEMSLKNIKTKIFTIVSLAMFSAGIIYVLFPKLDYLPQGNKNLIFNILIAPPGLSYNERYEMGSYLMKSVEKNINKDVDGVPGMDRVFFVSFGDFNLFGATSMHETRAKELIPFFAPIVNSMPSVFGVSLQSGVFEQGIGEGNTVNIDISGEKISDIANIGGQLYGATMASLIGSQVRPIPSVELIYPEVKIKANNDALRALNMSARDLGIVIDVVMDGRVIGDFEQDGKKKIDLVFKANEKNIQTPQDIMSTQIAVGNTVLPISSLATYENTSGISEIRHLNGKRTITLQVTPPPGMTIDEAIKKVSFMLEGMKKKGIITESVDINLSGTADKLSVTIALLMQNFILALVIVYLLMAALFGNFLYPIVIMFTVPLATAGGFLGLALTNTFLSPQPLDVLTMLGFIILVGIVVNNAILIVHQSLNYINNENMEHKKAVLEATKTRIRPIYMSSLTSIFGMLPLVLVPGPGSEFYRGLGSVITGGLAFSTIFTIFVTPALLMFFIRLEKRFTLSKRDKAHKINTQS
ncbi:MAG: efflux RND transporter permease subunit [Campylobacteraceae bacterium]|nr:efflux RND transporter permease subunit [Campylobacteraceae bacterium]